MFFPPFHCILFSAVFFLFLCITCEDSFKILGILEVYMGLGEQGHFVKKKFTKYYRIHRNWSWLRKPLSCKWLEAGKALCTLRRASALGCCWRRGSGWHLA